MSYLVRGGNTNKKKNPVTCYIVTDRYANSTKPNNLLRVTLLDQYKLNKSNITNSVTLLQG